MRVALACIGHPTKDKTRRSGSVHKVCAVSGRLAAALMF